MLENLLSVLKKNREVIVIGHNKCDIDSFISGKFLSTFLIKEGYNSRFVIINLSGNKDTHNSEVINKNMDSDTYNFLKSLNYKAENFIVELEEVKDAQFILVDHHETNYDVEIVGCIDHHKNSKPLNYLYHKYYDIGSCGMLIYELIKDYNKYYVFSSLELIEVLYSALVDTNGLRNTRATDCFKAMVNELKEKIQLSDEEFQKALEKCTFITDLVQPIDKLVENGLKSYNIADMKVKSSYVEIAKYNDKDASIWTDYIQKNKLNEDTDLWLLMIIDYENNRTLVRLIFKDFIDDKLYKDIVSRGTTVIPDLTEFLNVMKNTII